MGVDGQGAFASNIEALLAVTTCQFQDAEAGAIGLFRMAAVAHQHIHKSLDIRSDPGGLYADDAWRDVRVEAMTACVWSRTVVCWRLLEVRA